MKSRDSRCPTETTIDVIGGRWKVIVLWELARGVRRFGELHRALAGVTAKMLTQQLRELEKDGVVSRKVYAEVPPKVEYALTPLGETLRPILDGMDAWGRRYLRSASARDGGGVAALRTGRPQ